MLVLLVPAEEVVENLASLQLLAKYLLAAAVVVQATLPHRAHLVAVVVVLVMRLVVL